MSHFEPSKISPIKITQSTWQYLAANYQHVAKRGVFLIILLMSMELIVQNIIVPGQVGLQLFMLLLSFIVYTMISVLIHQMVLLKLPEEIRSYRFSWHQQESRYLMNLILLTIIQTLVLIPPVIAAFFIYGLSGAFSEVEMQTGSIVILVVLGVVSLVPFICIFSRFWLVLPATAIDHAIGLKDSWRISKSNGIRILLACSIPVAPFIALSYFLGTIHVTLSIPMNIASIIAGITALSLTYREITREPSAEH